ncbi:MAG: hypothetical protein KIH01_06255 [Candidatus Freyarchaeota archaeon]|nr:hypothetical protein [Candidatus Jordarchaeia archaeon]
MRINRDPVAQKDVSGLLATRTVAVLNFVSWLVGEGVFTPAVDSALHYKLR